MNFKISNIDDLSSEERNQLEEFKYYRLFRGGLFAIKESDLKIWEERYSFDAWLFNEFPKGYIDSGWFREDLDNIHDKLSNLIYNQKGEKELNKFIEILNNEHKTKSIEDVESAILKSMEKWEEKDLLKYSDENEWLMWLCKEICKV